MTSTEKAKAGLPLGGLEWGLRGLAWASDAAQAGGGGRPAGPRPWLNISTNPRLGEANSEEIKLPREKSVSVGLCVQTNRTLFFC